MMITNLEMFYPINVFIDLDYHWVQKLIQHGFPNVSFGQL